VFVRSTFSYDFPLDVINRKSALERDRKSAWISALVVFGSGILILHSFGPPFRTIVFVSSAVAGFAFATILFFGIARNGERNHREYRWASRKRRHHVGEPPVPFHQTRIGEDRVGIFGVTSTEAANKVRGFSRRIFRQRAKAE